MQRLATVLMRHETKAGGHYDWMLQTPASVKDLNARLWTARVNLPSWCWSNQSPWDLEMIGEHRSAYLTYEGPLTGGRGTVRRVDSGWVEPHLWSPDRIVFDMGMTHCCGRIQLERRDESHWQAMME